METPPSGTNIADEKSCLKSNYLEVLPMRHSPINREQENDGKKIHVNFASFGCA